jgi:WD40 repeat protein
MCCLAVRASIFLTSTKIELTVFAQVRSRFAMFTLSQHTHEVSAVDWSSDGNQFATGSKDGHVRCFKWNSNIASNSAEASE